MIERLEALVRGRVQGVGFRISTVHEAGRLGLEGSVSNRADGGVAVVAEGSRQDLERLLAFLHRGPPVARVAAVEVIWCPPLGGLGRFHVE